MATAKKKAPVKPKARSAAPATTKKAKSGPKPLAMQKLDAFGIDKLCAAITDGRTLTETAKAIGVSIGSLITWMDGDAERSVRAREARIQAAKGWDEKALSGILEAKNGFTLAKAKEAAHHLRWRASKIAPKEYGDKLAVGQADDLLPLVTVKDLTGRKDQ